MTELIESQPSRAPSIWTAEGYQTIKLLAGAFARSALVPPQYQGADNVPNCIVALNMAKRLDADPLMVMQNLYIVHGRPAWSAQFLIAAFNSCGRFTAIHYEFSGEGDEYGCCAITTERATGECIRGERVSIAMAKAEGWFDKKGSKWQTMPGQMLRYRAATFLVRAVAPELTMGISTVDETITEVA
ncbi:MAG: hypothetical protein NXI32_26985 [bacterium]|nr:hypothetical protein [bacterium]